MRILSRLSRLSRLAVISCVACGGAVDDARDGGDGSATIDDAAGQPDLVGTDDGVIHDLSGTAIGDFATSADMTFTGHVPRQGACTTAVVPSPGNQIAHQKGSTCAQLGYYDYTPSGYDTKANWPLILFFHGDGQRGNGTTDLASNLGDGLPKDIAGNKWDPGKRFVVLSPQMDDRNGLPERTAAYVKAFVEFAVANYDVDIHRVYITGLSGGGAPVYNYLAAESGGIAAATSIESGWYSTQGQECKWKNVPTWYFHGAVDGIVPANDHATKSFNTLVACIPAPATPPRYTLFKDVGHSAWNNAYESVGMNGAEPLVASPPGTTVFDRTLYDWFLQYTH